MILTSIQNLQESKKYEKYLVSYFSLLIQGILFFLSWYFDVRYFAYIAIILAISSNLLLSQNGMYLGHLIIFDMASYYKFPDFGNFPISIIIEACLILIGYLAIYIIKSINNRKFNFSFGAVGFSYSLLAILGILSGIINLFTHNNKYSVLSILVALGIAFIVLVYLLMVNSSTKDQNNYIDKIIYVFFLIILFELIANGYKKGIDFNLIKESKGIYELYDLGWTTSKNITSIALEICLPFLCYIFNKNKKRIDALICFLICLALILFSHSRGGLITAIIMLIPCSFIIGYTKRDLKRTITKGLLILSFVSGVSLILILKVDKIKNIVINVLTSLDNLTGRNEIWELALYQFEVSPIVGYSYSSFFVIGETFAGSLLPPLPPSGFSFALAHNTWVSILCSLGSLGIIIYIANALEELFTTFTFPKREMVLPLFCFFSIGFIHGIIDNTFFSPVFVFPLMLIYSQNEEINLFEYLNTRAHKNHFYLNK